MNILPYYRCVERVYTEILGIFPCVLVLIESSESVDNELSYIGTVEVVALFFFSWLGEVVELVIKQLGSFYLFIMYYYFLPFFNQLHYV